MSKSAVALQLFFEDMGFQYLGPVDGHDLDQLCHVLNWAKELRAPVVVHVEYGERERVFFLQRKTRSFSWGRAL